MFIRTFPLKTIPRTHSWAIDILLLDTLYIHASSPEQGPESWPKDSWQLLENVTMLLKLFETQGMKIILIRILLQQ
jgi:hypothetical protein